MFNIIYQNHKKYDYARVSNKLREANSPFESQKIGVESKWYSRK